MARSSKSSKGSTKQPEKAKESAAEETEISPEAGDTPESPKPEVDAQPVEDVAETTGDPVEEETVPDVAVEDTPAVEAGKTAEPDETAVPGVIPAQVAAPPPPVAPAASGPGTVSLIFGGLAAGAIGFLVATFAIPEGWPNPAPSGIDSVEASLAEQSEAIDALSAELAALREAAPSPAVEMPDLGPLGDRIAAVEGRIEEAAAALENRFGDLIERLDGMDARLVDVEQRPEAPSGPDGSAAMEAQLEAFRQQLDGVTADAEARIAEAQERANQIEAEAAEAAAAAERNAALSALQVALDSGTPFDDVLSAFGTVPEALSSIAGKGVPTLVSLQTDFPQDARRALAESVTLPENVTATERFAAFVRRQTNARSLAPREGDDPDAILSRAEASLSTGDLRAALDEVSMLPEGALGAMSGWIAAAETRLSALDAAETLKAGSN